jgi:transcriptional regulator with XRE-family HTH domain
MFAAMSHEIYAGFAKRLVDLCEDKKLPLHGRQAVLARVCGIKPSSVNKWFNAISLPDAQNLLKIADWGNTTVDWLLYGRKPISYADMDQPTKHVLQIMEKLDSTQKNKAVKMFDLFAEPADDNGDGGNGNEKTG